MGIWVHLGIWPDEGSELTQPQFIQLVSDLVTEHLVATPCTLLEGTIPISEIPLGIENMVHGYGAATLPETIKIRYQGSDLPELLRSLSAAPFGATDLCVLFDGFDWANATLQESFKQQHWANAAAALFALQAPQEVIFHEEITPFLEETDEDEEFEADPDEEEETLEIRTYTIQQGFFSYGKRGPEGIKDTPLDPVFRRHFGAEVWLDYDYS
jgi:hypothetical protein